MLRIGHIAEGVRECHLNGLQLTVTGLHTVLLRETEILKDIQRHKRYDALPVRRDLANIVAPVIHMYGLDPFRRIGRQILIADITTVSPALIIYTPGYITRVECVCARLSNGFQRVGMVGEEYHIARLIGPALRGKGAEPAAKSRRVAGTAVITQGILPVRGKIGGAGIALPGVLYRRSQIPGQ